MEIKCNTSPYYFNNYPVTGRVPCKSKNMFAQHAFVCAKKCAKTESIVKRPFAKNIASGLSSLINTIKQYAHNYIQNIKHTYEHKIIFALIEKEIFGKISKDSITHDLDKLILYILGFPKSFVSDFHRTHSEHHTESGKKMNLKSMICDNIASSPEFKPEKTKSLREHYNTCKALKSVNGLGEMLEKFHYGEEIDFNKIVEEKNSHFHGTKGILNSIMLFV